MRVPGGDRRGPAEVRVEVGARAVKQSVDVIRWVDVEVGGQLREQLRGCVRGHRAVRAVGAPLRLGSARYATFGPPPVTSVA